MKVPGGGLIVVGENFNTTRKIKATSPKVVRVDDKVGVCYVDLDGNKRVLDVTHCMPHDPTARQQFMIPHVSEACRQRDMSYIAWAIKKQERSGAHIIDLCVDELAVDPEERHEWMRWIVKTAQQITDSIVAIDSSDPETIIAGLDVHDSTKGPPAINSFNLEESRQVLVDVARDRKAILFANASGPSGMAHTANDRVENMVKCMALMDKGNVPMEDRFLDPLVFPIGAGPESGRHYLDAVAELRRQFPSVHIFGGHSNVSFGLPERKLLNFTFVVLAILAGCDSVMIDPIVTPVKDLNDFLFAANALTGKDRYSTQYLKYIRSLVSRASRTCAAG